MKMKTRVNTAELCNSVAAPCETNYMNIGHDVTVVCWTKETKFSMDVL